MMVCFLNINGLFLTPEDGGVFYIERLSALTYKGAIFDIDTNYGQIPGIIQVILTQILNYLFKLVAMYATDQENHSSNESYDSSLILKRFAFEFLDSFIYLFYVAFYHVDIPLLRQSLIQVFAVDEVRRIFCETVLPYLMQNTDKISQNL
jgi:hypothetical protein